MKASPHKFSQIVKRLSRGHGFDHCGISKAEFLPEEAPKLESWLNQGSHGRMGYMEKHFDKRLNPTKLVDGAKSVISVLYSYFPKPQVTSSLAAGKDGLKIAKYAYGEDYHWVIKSRLRSFVAAIEAEVGAISGRVFVDSAPIMEKAWAAKAGLGWIGKNTNILNRSLGSFFFIAEIITDLELEPDSPIGDYCGTCTRCVDACPTDALANPYTIDATRCISYLTIELRGEIDPQFKGQMEDWIFGCDICQDVCPWNRFSRIHDEPRFDPSKELLDLSGKELKEITRDVFKRVFKDSAVKRTRFEGFVRNIQFVSNKKSPE